jgi:hypothetical protein
MNSEKSKRTYENGGDQAPEAANSLDYREGQSKSRGVPFKKSASNFIKSNKVNQNHKQGSGTLNINLDIMCALTGLTNTQLKNLIDTDFQAEKKIADRIIAKSQVTQMKQMKERQESYRLTKTTREQT